MHIDKPFVYVSVGLPGHMHNETQIAKTTVGVQEICWNLFGLEVLSSNDSENVLQFESAKSPDLKRWTTCGFACLFGAIEECLCCSANVVDGGDSAGSIDSNNNNNDPNRSLQYGSSMLALQFHKFHFAFPQKLHTPCDPFQCRAAHK